MTFGKFLRANRRWLAGGATLTLFSGAGQTYYIALYAGDIRASFELSHGQFGSLYMLATLASAITLALIGRVVDVRPVRTVACSVILSLTAACALMASSGSLVTLGLAIFALRLFGQGMMTHTALTAMGRWFRLERGRAVAVTSIGIQLGEGVLPLAVVTLLALVDWRTAWWLTGAALLFLALPITFWCFSRGRQPRATAVSAGEVGRQWTRREVIGSTSFWLLCTAVLAPPFIGTSVFFHQIHIGELKGWAPSVMASSFAVLALTSSGFALWAGQLIDRFSARHILPLFMVPLAAGCWVLSIASAPLLAGVFMALLGASNGISSAVFGAIWPEVYGTRHLGAIRSLVFAGMVFSSALGPGLTGWFIDLGVGFELQIQVMGAYALLAAAMLVPLSRHLRQLPGSASRG